MLSFKCGWLSTTLFMNV